MSTDTGRWMDESSTSNMTTNLHVMTKTAYCVHWFMKSTTDM